MPRRKSLSESLRDILRGLEVEEHQAALVRVGILTKEHVHNLSSPDELPVQFPGAARRELYKIVQQASVTKKSFKRAAAETK